MSIYPGFLIIDDTLSKKDIYTKHIEGLDFHNYHEDGNKPMWSHCVVTLQYTINDYSIPLNFKLYQRKKVLIIFSVIFDNIAICDKMRFHIINRC